MSRDDYTPIACGLYSEYEVAILYRKTLRLWWRDDNGEEHSGLVVPRDLQSRDGTESLLRVLVGGEAVVIRLDRIFHREEELL